MPPAAPAPQSGGRHVASQFNARQVTGLVPAPRQFESKPDTQKAPRITEHNHRIAEMPGTGGWEHRETDAAAGKKKDMAQHVCAQHVSIRSKPSRRTTANAIPGTRQPSPPPAPASPSANPAGCRRMPPPAQNALMFAPCRGLQMLQKN
ncbi:hypothetical protein NPIL_609031 [Nephila pilipes]|uniref:Uncharacterized protein n=1 Tax=Nephila pilipes TaxID=299642 RepID=A0A8X6PZ07_NEPPI|nr:hypothetical protein NPIL_609031 [Nephila pilipes]